LSQAASAALDSTDRAAGRKHSAVFSSWWPGAERAMGILRHGQPAVRAACGVGLHPRRRAHPPNVQTTRAGARGCSVHVGSQMHVGFRVRGLQVVCTRGGVCVVCTRGTGCASTNPKSERASIAAAPTARGT